MSLDFLWVDPHDLLPRDRGLLGGRLASLALGKSLAADELGIAADGIDSSLVWMKSYNR
jgi:hypothetical protein